MILMRVLCGSLLVGLALPPGVRAQNLSNATPVGDPIRGEKIALSCSGCHGNNGISAEAWIPSLAGLDRGVIYKQLDDYRSHRRRPEWYMASIAQALSLQDSADVSAYYERQVRKGTQPVLRRLAWRYAAHAITRAVAILLRLRGNKRSTWKSNWACLPKEFAPMIGTELCRR